MPLCRKKTFIMQIRTYNNLTVLYNASKKHNTKFVLYKMYILHLLMQMWHTGDYCTIDTSLFPCYIIQLS